MQIPTTILDPIEKQFVEKATGMVMPSDIANIDVSKIEGITDAILNTVIGKPDDEKNFAMNVYFKFATVERGT